MKANQQLFLFILLLHSLISCSSLQRFFIYNNSTHEILISYNLDKNDSTLNRIFNKKTFLYTLDSGASIIPSIDLDTSENGIQILMPPNSKLEIGALFHHHYNPKVDKNNWNFNLETVHIEQINSIIEITRENFDDFFEILDGDIVCQVKNSPT